MMTVYEQYQDLSFRFNKLLDSYKNLLNIYKITERQLYNNNTSVVKKIREELKDELSKNISTLNKECYCPHIRDYCLYINTDFCINVCNEKRYRGL